MSAVLAMNYSSLVHAHFTRPRNVGRLESAPDVLSARAGSKAQGVEIALSARIDGNRLVTLHHLVYGCPHTIAAVSWLTERLEGAGIEMLESWRWRDAADALEVPTEKWGRLLVLEDAVRALAREWRNRLSNHAQRA
jgi:NifU-like protein involved in Fe-S cluster formation